MRKRIPKPPFLVGGKLDPNDKTVRNSAGYPLDDNGEVDLLKAAGEVDLYQGNVLSKKKTNSTSPKKKRT